MSKKILYLLRHAKSSWDEPGLTDIERPLNGRGKKAAPVIGKHMRKVGASPDRILVSPAKRTRQTAKLTLEEAKSTAQPEFDERIYAADYSQLMEVLSEVSAEAAEVLLIGHNPGMEDLHEMLTGSYERFPTAALARIELSIESWSDIAKLTGKLDWIVRPKELIEA